MSKLLLPLAILIAAVSLTGCSLWGGKNKKPKSSARVYEGEAPSIRYNDKAETAGGRLNPY